VPDLLLLAEVKLNAPGQIREFSRLADRWVLNIEMWRQALATQAQLLRRIKTDHE